MNINFLNVVYKICKKTTSPENYDCNSPNENLQMGSSTILDITNHSCQESGDCIIKFIHGDDKTYINITDTDPGPIPPPFPIPLHTFSLPLIKSTKCEFTVHPELNITFSPKVGPEEFYLDCKGGWNHVRK